MASDSRLSWQLVVTVVVVAVVLVVRCSGNGGEGSHAVPKVCHKRENHQQEKWSLESFPFFFSPALPCLLSFASFTCRFLFSASFCTDGKRIQAMWWHRLAKSFDLSRAQLKMTNVLTLRFNVFCST